MKHLLALATVILASVYLVGIALTESFQDEVPDMSMDWTGKVTKGETDVELLKH